MRRAGEAVAHRERGESRGASDAAARRLSPEVAHIPPGACPAALTRSSVELPPHGMAVTPDHTVSTPSAWGIMPHPVREQLVMAVRVVSCLAQHAHSR